MSKMTTAPTTVYARVRILHVWSVDVVAETFKVELAVTYGWRCPDSQSQEALAQGGADSLQAEWVPAWYPRLGLWNTVELLYESERSFSAERMTDGSGTWIKGRLRFAATVPEQFELEAYRVQKGIKLCAPLMPWRCQARTRARLSFWQRSMCRT